MPVLRKKKEAVSKVCSSQRRGEIRKGRKDYTIVYEYFAILALALATLRETFLFLRQPLHY